MIVIQQLYTKTDPATPWYFQVWTPELTEHMLVTYHQTGKLDGAFAPAEDGLSLTITQIFSDQDAKDQFDNDTFLIEQRALREAYNDTHGIILASVTQL
jgi:hypothetical protein